jgi:hypothetical protein
MFASVCEPKLKDISWSLKCVYKLNIRKLNLFFYELYYWEKRNAYRILVGKPEGKRPVGKRRRGWVDNIKIYLREIGWDGVDWIY